MTKPNTSLKQGEMPSKYDKLSSLKDDDFRRLTGVSRRVFTLMVEILMVADAQKKAKGGRKSKLGIEDRLLMALEYLREYRTYFHIAQNYGISESNAYKICKWVEDTLVKDKRFALPGRKALQDSETAYEVILIDASESPVERPKKTKALLFWQKEASYTQNPGRCSQAAQARGYGNSSTSDYMHEFQSWQETRLPFVQKIQGEPASNDQSSDG